MGSNQSANQKKDSELPYFWLAYLLFQRGAWEKMENYTEVFFGS